MSDLLLKPSTAAPHCSLNWVWVRTISSSPPSSSCSHTSVLRPTNSKAKLPLSLLLNYHINYNNTLNHHLRTKKDGWRITSCAPPMHDKPFSLHILGFPFHGHLKSLSVCSSSSSSCCGCSSSEGGLGFSEYSNSNSGSSSDLGGVLADMGSENNEQHHQPHHQRYQTSKFLTLPTILTLGRVAAVPLLICAFHTDSSWGAAATTSIFIAAAITDWLDGYIARKMKLESAFGAFLDPVADKLMVAATLVLLCTKPLDVAILGQVRWLLTVPSIIIIGREITMSAVREWAASQNPKLLEAVAVNSLGKWKTAAQMTSLAILLATRDNRSFSSSHLGSLGAPGVLVGSGVLLLYISAGLTFWSLVAYMGKIWKVLLK